MVSSLVMYTRNISEGFLKLALYSFGKILHVSLIGQYLLYTNLSRTPSLPLKLRGGLCYNLRPNVYCSVFKFVFSENRAFLSQQFSKSCLFVLR